MPRLRRLVQAAQKEHFYQINKDHYRRTLERLRKQAALSRGAGRSVIVDRASSGSFVLLTRRADLVVLGIVVDFSSVYEKWATAYHDVIVDVQEVIRARAGVNASSGRVLFHKLGGTLHFPEGDVTFTESGNGPFQRGETVILRFSIASIMCLQLAADAGGSRKTALRVRMRP